MMGGLSYMTGPKGRPLRAGTSVNDIMGGMFGAIGVLAALRERDRTGRGQEIQSALFENCVFLSRAAHAAVLDDRRGAAADAVARLGVERLRRVHAGRRRAALHRRGQRQAVPDAVPRDRARPTSPPIPRLRPTRSASRCGPSCCARLGEILQHHRIDELVAEARSGRHSVCADRAARAAARRPAPAARAAAWCRCRPTTAARPTSCCCRSLLGGRRPGVRQPLPRVGEHTDEVLAALRQSRRLTRFEPRITDRRQAMTLDRIARRSVLVAALAARASARGAALAADKPLRVILPVGAGSGVDTHRPRASARR